MHYNGNNGIYIIYIYIYIIILTTWTNFNHTKPKSMWHHQLNKL